MSDIEFLEAKVNGLERENRLLRSTLWDQYFCAAINGFLADGVTHRISPISAVQSSAHMADEMMKIRAGRFS